MSQAACGGGMKGSGDGEDNAGGGGGRDKRKMPVDYTPPSTDVDSDDDDDQADDGGKASRRSTLDCLDSLEASLPMKKGLSSHYHGKSKSFGNLQDMGLEDAKDLGKKEHPLNKRRRLLLDNEQHSSSDASKTSLFHISSLPAVLPSHDQHKKDEDDDPKGRNDQDQEDGK